MYIGNKLKALRTAKGMTQKNLSEQCNISCSFLNDIEKERSNPSFENLLKICEVLGVDITYFFNSLNDTVENTIYSEIQSYLIQVKNWHESDQLELLHYLKAKTISKQ